MNSPSINQRSLRLLTKFFLNESINYHDPKHSKSDENSIKISCDWRLTLTAMISIAIGRNTDLHSRTVKLRLYWSQTVVSNTDTHYNYRFKSNMGSLELCCLWLRSAINSKYRTHWCRNSMDAALLLSITISGKHWLALSMYIFITGMKLRSLIWNTSNVE